MKKNGVLMMMIMSLTVKCYHTQTHNGTQLYMGPSECEVWGLQFVCNTKGKRYLDGHIQSLV